MARRDSHGVDQDELPFSSIKAHAVFPGRTTLYVSEVADKLEVTSEHILNLIDLGEIRAINIAADVKGGLTNGEGKTPRAKAKFFRIPVLEYDALVERGRSDK